MKNGHDQGVMIDGKPMKVFKHVIPGRATLFYIRKPGVTVNDGNIFAQTFHNESGAAIDWHGPFTNKEWYQYGKRHRFDGPAINRKHPNDKQVKLWYLYGNHINETEYRDWLREMDMDIHRLTPEDKLLIGLKWNV